MDTVTTSRKATPRSAAFLSTGRSARGWMLALLFLGDIVLLSLVLGMAVAARHFWFGGVGDLGLYWKTAPVLGVFFLLAAWQGLYSGGGNSPVRELRLLSESISVTFLLLMAFTFFTQTGTRFSRFIFLGGWALALLILPLGRWSLRFLAARLGVWGEPLVVLGNGRRGRAVVETLSRQLYLGLRPVALVTAAGDDSDSAAVPVSVRRFESPEHILRYLHVSGLETLIIIPDELPEGWVSAILDTSNSHIRRAFFLSDLDGLCGVDVRAYDFNGMLGLELHQNLLSAWGRFIKRSMDLILSLIGGIFLLPLGALLAVLIKLDSPGPVFYRQKRIGRYGKVFSVWKFRTMAQNADTILQQYLEHNPELRAEWALTQKLKDDPRITRVGRILRQYSLDEVPQLINVLRGEMSIVGPRPCMPQQIELYGHIFELYKRVRPGITGMWQVSGRNETTYAERVRLDEYYVRNWSIWLDIYILIRTVWVVLRREGAY